MPFPSLPVTNLEEGREKAFPKVHFTTCPYAVTFLCTDKPTGRQTNADGAFSFAERHEKVFAIGSAIQMT